MAIDDGGAGYGGDSRPDLSNTAFLVDALKATGKPLVLVLTSCSLSDTRVTATATYGDPANRGFPGKDYTRLEYPGLSAR